MGERKAEVKGRPEKVYLVEGLPPLRRKTVEKIQRGEFVEFADFPVFDGGRREGEWSAEHLDKGGRSVGGIEEKGTQ